MKPEYDMMIGAVSSTENDVRHLILVGQNLSTKERKDFMSAAGGYFYEGKISAEDFHEIDKIVTAFKNKNYISVGM